MSEPSKTIEKGSLGMAIVKLPLVTAAVVVRPVAVTARTRATFELTDPRSFVATEDVTGGVVVLSPHP